MIRLRAAAILAVALLAGAATYTTAGLSTGPARAGATLLVCALGAVAVHVIGRSRP